MTRRKETTLELAPLDDLGREVQAVLRQDTAEGRRLAQPDYELGSMEFDGYCAVASAAYFFLAGGGEAG